MPGIKLSKMDYSQNAASLEVLLKTFMDSFFDYQKNPSQESYEHYLHCGISMLLFSAYPAMVGLGKCDQSTRIFKDSIFENIEDNLLILEDRLKERKEETWKQSN